MSRRSAHLDFSIIGDELEQQRVQLEHNLQHTDISLHLSSTPGDYSDVEYPRHASVPSPPFSAFASFDHRSANDYDPHDQSRFHPWSYHTDDGVQPYAAESLSTAAHHASALTISAGLAGRGPRRDISLSGAEYDPDRPLQGMVAGITGRFNGFDANSTKSKHITASVVDFDPLIVDDTAELDRVLQSGHAPPAMIRSSRSLSSSSSSDLTEPISPQPQHDSRPRLADALSHLAFSPKRPRSAQGFTSPRMSNLTIRSTTPDRSTRARHMPASTPRPQRRMNQSLSYAQNTVSASNGHAEPEVHITPATPSLRQSRREQQHQQGDESSKFTAMARGLQREIEAEANAFMKRNTRQAAGPEGTPRSMYHHSTIPVKKYQHQRSPLKEMMNEKPERSFAATPFKKSVQLPDVTGLTSAIASPVKVDVEFYGYDPKDTTEAEARLIATLTVVQNKLIHLEAENSFSRRRVRELELELEACKKEVARERTRILVHEQSITRNDDPSAGKRPIVSQPERTQQQQQKKAEEDQTELAAAEARYTAAVEEKKTLEALIATLRAHLTRLTAELSEHKQLLLELRSLRDSDARALAEKSKEVDKLKQEVERLAGEVEVLRGVVEEGLKARRNFREQSISHEHESAAESAERSSEEETEDEEQQPQPQLQQQQRARPPSVHSIEESEDEVSEDESIGHRSPTPSPRRLGVGAADKTIRTDHATVASSQGPSLTASANVTRPFLAGEEVSQIAQEVSERRSERSIQSRSQDDSQSASGSQEGSRSWSRQPNPTQSRRVSRVGSPSMMFEPDASGSTARQNPVPQPEHSVRFAAEPGQGTDSRPPSPLLDTTQAQAQPRPTAPTPAAAQRSGGGSGSGGQKRRAHTAPQAGSEPAFPQIRGQRLERLFFSAPEHNAETCTVCHRRRRRRPADVEQAASWLRERQQCRAEDEEDEGFAEGPEGARARGAYAAKAARDREDDRVPPQTVLARVLRELEDDFTHYKSIYVELADQYKDMDPVSNVVKRNVLADHLREVIDILEQKGNQIASLYDLLTFKDKPISESVVPNRASSRNAPLEAAMSHGRVPLHRCPSS